jgi:hypothetical protein
MTPTNGRKPRTGEMLLRVQFRNGQESRHEYTAAQLRWSDTGDDWDVIAVEKSNRRAA